MIGGTTSYFLRLEGGTEFYQCTADKVPLAILLNVGDQVTIRYTDADGGVARIAGSVERTASAGTASAAVSRFALPETSVQENGEDGGQENPRQGDAA